MSSSSSHTLPPFTDADYQAAAAAYMAGGSAPTWWSSQIQNLNTAYGTGSGSSPPQPTGQTILGQQAVNTAATAQQKWLSGLSAFRQGSTTPLPASASWTQAMDAQGRIIYRNSATGEVSYSPPDESSITPKPPTPTVDDVSRYLAALLAPGSAAPPSSAQLAAMNAGSANANWLSGLNEYRLGSEAIGSYGVGSVVPRGVTAGSLGSALGVAASSAGLGGSRQLGPNITPISSDEARGIRSSEGSGSAKSTYATPITEEPKAMGPITTLLDLTNRDLQENDIFPIRSEITWFTRDQNRRLLSFTPVVQETALRGPAAFGQRFTFDLGSIQIGDLLLGTALQIRLDHWLDPQTQNIYAAGKINYEDRAAAWEYANSLGSAIIQLAELEIDGKTLETIDGDFIHTFSSLFAEYNTQFGIAYDHLGQTTIKRLIDTMRPPNLFPIENGNLNCILPFFFMRSRLQEALPMIAIREGNVKIHITLRPFDQCVRQMRGYRDTCTSVPPPVPTNFTFSSCTWTYTPAILSGTWDIFPRYSFTITQGNTNYNWNYSVETQRGRWVNTPTTPFTVAPLYNWNPTGAGSWTPIPPIFNIAYEAQAQLGRFYYWDGVPQAWRSGPLDAGKPAFAFTYGDNGWKSSVGDWSVAAPPFKSVQLLTYGAIVDGSYRSKMLYEPFEILHRQVQTFSFDEPLKYSVGKRQDTIRVQLPLEANHPIEEIIWFIRRKGASMNNEWTNYSSVLESEWLTRAKTPMLQNAIIQVNGTSLCDADEQFYRESIASAHRGGYAAYSRFIYGYSFGKTPGEHQPSGSMNASRLNALRLVLDVTPPGGINDAQWEVKVFCIGMNWLRFENGLANPMFED